MINNQLNRERLEKIKSWRETYGAGSNVMLPAEEAEALALIALAAMDSEPVALKPELAKVIYHFRDWNEGFPVERFKADYVISWMLANYPPAQPAPVVPEEATPENVEMLSGYVSTYKLTDSERDIAAEIWNACRAAMLQAGTLNNEGTKQAWTGIPDIDNAINMLDRIDTLDSCDDDRIEAVKTVLRRLAGNSPVIPDGYVMVPKEMTDEIGEAIAMQANCCGGIALDIYDAMIAAAPHDTPALNSVQSVVHVSDGWIPVSERMPEDDDFVYIWPRPDFGVELHIGQYCERNHKGGGWYAQVYEQNYGIEWHPITVTHWMPLPAGPQGVKGE